MFRKRDQKAGNPEETFVIPELRKIVSADIDYGQVPEDVDDCAVACQADIGPRGEKGQEIFSFTVVTPKILARQTGYIWGRGYLIVESFSWETVDRALSKLLTHCNGTTWREVAAKLNEELHWEFDTYRESV